MPRMRGLEDSLTLTPGRSRAFSRFSGLGNHFQDTLEKEREMRAVRTAVIQSLRLCKEVPSPLLRYQPLQSR